MKIFYKSQRIGKNEKRFNLIKFCSLKENSDIKSFINKEQYTWGGRFLRKTKIDELPQLWNILRRDMNIVGPRPEEERTINLLPEATKNILLSVRPGLTSLASIHFFDEGQILEKDIETHKIYWEKIKPIKIVLDCFYIQNRDILLDIWIVWKTAILIIKSVFKR